MFIIQIVSHNSFNMSSDPEYVYDRQIKRCQHLLDHCVRPTHPPGEEAAIRRKLNWLEARKADRSFLTTPLPPAGYFARERQPPQVNTPSVSTWQCRDLETASAVLRFVRQTLPIFQVVQALRKAYAEQNQVGTGETTIRLMLSAQQIPIETLPNDIALYRDDLNGRFTRLNHDSSQLTDHVFNIDAAVDELKGLEEKAMAY